MYANHRVHNEFQHIMALESLSAHLSSPTGEKPETRVTGSISAPEPATAKAYNKVKLLIGVASSALSFLFLLTFVLSGYSRMLEQTVTRLFTQPYVALVAFVFATGLVQSAITLPFGFYSGYIVEHRYNLSTQTPGKWIWERLKGLLVAVPLATAVLVVLYYCLANYGDLWWLPVGTALTLFSILLARLAPILIFPLFYKFTPIEDGTLRQRILALSKEAGLQIEGIYAFNMSKNTRKANAGFAGIGRSKRIILGDTLLKEFTEDEITTVFAHELGHYKHRHIVRGIVAGTVSTFAGLFLTSHLYGWSVQALGFAAITDLAALPLLALWLTLYGLVTSPIGNMFSRRHERQADAYAVQTTRNTAAFVSALRKLSRTNLADPDPHPAVEFLFYSHPSIGRRVRAVEAMTGSWVQ